MTPQAPLTPPPTPAPVRETPLPGARLALILLLSINFFNFIDRQVLAAVEPEIRKGLLLSDDPKDADAKFKMGLLSSAFMVTYMLTAPLFGLLAERMSRWVLVGIGVVIWSLASGGSGLAGTFVFLFLTRCLVGVGEGAYGPVAPTMISDLYPVKVRGSVLAWFYVAIPVGSALGYTLGGQVVAAGLSWRWAFYLVVIPGLLLGIWCFLMPEPPRGRADAVEGGHRLKLKDLRILLKTPSYVLDTLGMTATTFALGGLAFFMADYLEGRGVEKIGPLSPTTFFGGLTALAGLLATITGGITGDRLRSRFPGSYFLVSGVANLLGFPMILLVIWTPFPYAWIFLFLAVFWVFFNTGPANTILANVTHPALRASGFAFNILVIHALGDVISPPILGWVAGHAQTTLAPATALLAPVLGPNHIDMDVGFFLVSLAILLGGCLWLWGSRYLERDTALAPTRLGST